MTTGGKRCRRYEIGVMPRSRRPTPPIQQAGFLTMPQELIYGSAVFAKKVSRCLANLMLRRTPRRVHRTYFASRRDEAPAANHSGENLTDDEAGLSCLRRT